MAQETAVEWLVEQLELIWSIENLPKYIAKKKEVIDQAKQMEKEQIIDAHNHGEYNSQFIDALDDINGIEYYNKTYTK